MMFGFRDKFDYVECTRCGCVQIQDVPADLSKYYPDEYYSFKKLEYPPGNFISSFIRRQRANYCLYQQGILGKLFAMKLGIPDYYGWLTKAKVRFESNILEVGCGAGNLLRVLAREGFSNLIGVDPYINKDISYDSGVRILKKDVQELKGDFDFIMMHHSFEHMPDSHLMMRELYRLLKPGRFALVRIPIASSYAWKKYGVNWVQLDPPRHLYLHTVKSMQILADESGFKLTDVVYDSFDFQFWGSEQYIRDIPLNDKKSYQVDPSNSIFSNDEIQKFREKAVELNKSKDGDQASFYLYKE